MRSEPVPRAASEPEPIGPIVTRVLAEIDRVAWLHRLSHLFPNTAIQYSDGAWKRLVPKPTEGCVACALALAWK